ncbi:hypothetical protein [Consotaella aegiceratis]|uniref:hypothetical protein n=1 Tax=Consotaella aegiceratis TaxID=3097961 RepID=UPI002F407061
MNDNAAFEAHVAYLLARLGIEPDISTMLRINELAADLERVAAHVRTDHAFGVEPLFGVIAHGKAGR